MLLLKKDSHTQWKNWKLFLLNDLLKLHLGLRLIK